MFPQSSLPWDCETQDSSNPLLSELVPKWGMSHLTFTRENESQAWRPLLFLGLTCLNPWLLQDLPGQAMTFSSHRQRLIAGIVTCSPVFFLRSWETDLTARRWLCSSEDRKIIFILDFYHLGSWFSHQLKPGQD